MTIAEASKLFLTYARVERRYARETVIKLGDCIRSWVIPSIGDVELGDLTRISLMQLHAAMVNRGVGTYRQYSVLTTLKLFLKFCREVLKEQTVDPAEVRLPKRETPHVVYLTNEEIQRVQEAIPMHTVTGLRLRTLVEVLLQTGLRISEALALDRTPFELGQKEIEIAGKGGKRRVVLFTDQCLFAIKRYLNKRQDSNPALFITTGYPRRLSRHDISKMFKRLRRDAQIDKPLTPHLLRHTFCTNLLHNGADITFIKELAGHQDIQTTARYYLGVDRQALRRVLTSCLDYSTSAPKDITPVGAAA